MTTSLADNIFLMRNDIPYGRDYLRSLCRQPLSAYTLNIEPQEALDNYAHDTATKDAITLKLTNIERNKLHNISCTLFDTIFSSPLLSIPPLLEALACGALVIQHTPTQWSIGLQAYTNLMQAWLNTVSRSNPAPNLADVASLLVATVKHPTELILIRHKHDILVSMELPTATRALLETFYPYLMPAYLTARPDCIALDWCLMQAQPLQITGLVEFHYVG